MAKLPQNASREIFFELLTIFISQHRQYFEAAVRNSSYYLLEQILIRCRRILVKSSLSEKAFLSYVGALVVVLMWCGGR